jgi:hypothetical protein
MIRKILQSRVAVLILFLFVVVIEGSVLYPTDSRSASATTVRPARLAAFSEQAFAYLDSATMVPEPPLLNPTEGPGGPVLIISSTTNPFSRYAVEILRAEGLNYFDAEDISVVNATMVDNYDVVILGEMKISRTDADMFTRWVNEGGTLIAFKPDSVLSPLFGISAAKGAMSDKYLLVNTSVSPGAGIVDQTIQYHGTANLHSITDATMLATLYSSATDATDNPAVTWKKVGTNGGIAAAFTYDLAKSIVLTRQGNPEWASQKRDGHIDPIRSDDLFFPDWIDFNKVPIPQADEQQRLLANIILQGNLNHKPLPRFWYLPRDMKAVIVMTGDDHAKNQTAIRFDQYLAHGFNTPEDIADWKAVRATSYIYPQTGIQDEEAAVYEKLGFEIALHPTTNCTNYTENSLEADFTTQLNAFAKSFPSLSTPVTNRTHCLAWSDWSSTPKVEVRNGIRLDATYYYWPASWLKNRSGMFTGSGMPMRFADLDGTLIDSYQVVTQMTDESGLNVEGFCDLLLDRALGAEGYYGVFCANMHTDIGDHQGSDAIVASARSRGVPVISAKQLLTWLDARNNSFFSNLEWQKDQLSFYIMARNSARNLRAMLPVYSAKGRITSITMEGKELAYSLETIKGIEYAFFDAARGSHSYRAMYQEMNPPSNTQASARQKKSERPPG